MPTLSICLPTNRPLDQSSQTIENVYELSRHPGIEVIVSDNSKQKAKELKYKERCSNNFQYLLSPYPSALENWRHALNSANGEYISFLSDDDLLIKFPNSKSKEIDIPKTAIGARPHMALYAEEQGMYNHNNFDICDLRAIDRLKKYLSLNNGANTTIFSFFKKNLVADFYTEFYETHPTRGNYTDWATVLGFLSMGPLVKNNDFLYIYNNANWNNQTKVTNSIRNTFLQANLPPETAQILPVLNALDSFSSICRAASPTASDEKLEAANYALITYFRIFAESIFNIETNKKPGLERIHIAKQIVEKAITSIEMLAASLLITDIWLPGYGEKYQDYFKKVIDKKILHAIQL